jgi:hypothetical protein
MPSAEGRELTLRPGLLVRSQDGRLRLVARAPICHGFANACVCAECTTRERERVEAPPQPWDPRPARQRGPIPVEADDEPHNWLAWDSEDENESEVA